jgi:osmoprotectant transport system substrate-binding protein
VPAKLTVSTSRPAEDKDSITVTKQTADKYNLKSIADLQPVAGQLTLGGRRSGRPGRPARPG